MSSQADGSFAARICERYPEGLTGVIVFGGTRTTFLLDHQKESQEAGKLSDWQHYAQVVSKGYRDLLATFFDLGGQNVIVPILSYQSFESSRGEAYASLSTRLTHWLMQNEWLDFYREQDVDPYFVGIDTLLQFPDRADAYALAQACQRFNQTWSYQEGRHKLIWEIAPIPLFSFLRASQTMPREETAALEAQLSSPTSLQAMHDALYRYCARAVYGTEIPPPHFYLASNRNGDIKLRAMLPIALSCGTEMRLYYTPYPTLYLKRETFRALLEDLAFGKALRSTELDYAGKFTPEVMSKARERIHALSDDPQSTVGLLFENSDPSDD